ncbi:MAG: polysaccharide deacetylase family protein [Rhodobacteraceae bacterium]|nr:polysaccharide deacetylase family protein [Paracoccaceae bacterium]
MKPNRGSLSLDLDNLWSYMKTHGDPGWNAFPSYLDIVVPRFLSLLDEFSMKITVFVVGQDAALEYNHAALRSIPEAGHEIGNHSFKHEPWLHLYSEAEVVDEIRNAEAAIEGATGQRPNVFRGPGYSLSETVLRVLADRGYACDCSTFPTFVGPLARAYYFLNARLDTAQKAKRKALFGGLRDGIRPLRPYRWDVGGAGLLEIPVATMPVIRMPIHFSYLHWLAGMSEGLSRTYFATALSACRLAGIEPSLLLHPLDFLGKDDAPQLGFFPAMDQGAAEKMDRMRRLLSILDRQCVVETIGAHAGRLAAMQPRLRRPDFKASKAEDGGPAGLEQGG